MLSFPVIEFCPVVSAAVFAGPHSGQMQNVHLAKMIVARFFGVGCSGGKTGSRIC